MLWVYGPHPYRNPYRKPEVWGPDGTGMVPYIRHPYSPYIWGWWASLIPNSVILMVVKEVIVQKHIQCRRKCCYRYVMRVQALQVHSTFVHFHRIDFVHYHRIDFVHSCDVTLYITMESPVHSEEAHTMIMIEASIQSVYWWCHGADCTAKQHAVQMAYLSWV